MTVWLQIIFQTETVSLLRLLIKVLDMRTHPCSAALLFNVPKKRTVPCRIYIDAQTSFLFSIHLTFWLYFNNTLFLNTEETVFHCSTMHSIIMVHRCNYKGHTVQSLGRLFTVSYFQIQSKVRILSLLWTTISNCKNCSTHETMYLFQPTYADVQYLLTKVQNYIISAIWFSLQQENEDETHPSL